MFYKKLTLASVGSSFGDIDSDYIEKLVEALEFASNYYSIRDLIYISFSKGDSIEWEYKENKYEIRVKDPTIFRQLASEAQCFILNSQEAQFDDLNVSERMKLLNNINEFSVDNLDLQKVQEDIEKEMMKKIQYFSSYIPEDSDIDVGGYKYKEFFAVYKELLFIALYERYNSKANNLSCVITYPENDLSDVIAKNISIKKEKCICILRDISASSRCTFNYFSDNKDYILFPYCFSLIDGINGFLKNYAHKDSSSFSANCADIIGSALVEKVSGYFNKYRNFYVFREVKLKKYNTELPDIDVLAVSYEPSLGFHFFCCEVKNNLTASWAKEYLKSTGKKGYIEKAISQSDKIKKFLKTQEGMKFLYEKIKLAFSDIDMEKLFPTGFCAIIDSIIVTSQSIGMFFPNSNTTIINDDLLRKFIVNSDGDVNFIKACLHNINKEIDSSYRVRRENVNACGVEIIYDIPVLEKILTIIQNKYLSVNELENLESESLKSGYRFIDTIVT